MKKYIEKYKETFNIKYTIFIASILSIIVIIIKNLIDLRKIYVKYESIIIELFIPVIIIVTLISIYLFKKSKYKLKSQEICRFDQLVVITLLTSMILGFNYVVVNNAIKKLSTYILVDSNYLKLGSLNIIIIVCIWIIYKRINRIEKSIVEKQINKDKDENYLVDCEIDSITNDILGIEDDVNHITDEIINYESKRSRVLGLVGEWGIGKTSMLNIIKNNIQNKKDEKGNEEYIVIDFNPWIYDSSEAIFNALYSMIISKTKTGAIESSYLVKKYRESIFTGATIQLAGVSMDFNSNKHNIVEKIIETTNKKIKETGKKFVVIVDDIDRLDDDEVVDTFKFLRSVLNFEGITYIVAYDEIIVNKIFEKKFENPKYTEKIISKKFYVSKIPEDKLIEIGISYCKGIIDEFDSDVEKTLRLIFSQFLTLREVKQYCVTLKKDLAIQKHKSLFIPDLIIVTYIKFTDFEIYKKLSLFRDELFENDNKELEELEKSETGSYTIVTNELKKMFEYNTKILDVICVLIPGLKKRITGIDEIKDLKIETSTIGSKRCKDKYYYYDYFMYYESQESKAKMIINQVREHLKNGNKSLLENEMNGVLSSSTPNLNLKIIFLQIMRAEVWNYDETVMLLDYLAAEKCSEDYKKRNKMLQIEIKNLIDYMFKMHTVNMFRNTGENPLEPALNAVRDMAINYNSCESEQSWIARRKQENKGE